MISSHCLLCFCPILPFHFGFVCFHLHSSLSVLIQTNLRSTSAVRPNHLPGLKGLRLYTSIYGNICPVHGQFPHQLFSVEPFIKWVRSWRTKGHRRFCCTYDAIQLISKIRVLEI